MSGGDQPPDDLEIPDDAIVWRRVVALHYDPATHLPTTAAFSDSSDKTPMSGTIAPAGSSVAEYAKRWKVPGVVQFTVGQLRLLGFGVTWIPDDDDPYHVGIHGPKTPSRKKNLKRTCAWAYEPNR